MDYSQVSDEESEVDDWIASYTYLYSNESVFCTPQYLNDKFGIKPCQYVDFKSMVGDKADNIAGIEKVGVKRASELLNMYVLREIGLKE